MHKRVSGGIVSVEVCDGVLRARGLPYGRARRFEAAEPAPAWTGERDATQPGPACPQRPSRLAFVSGPMLDGLRVDEDCLVLSVTAPQDADGLPVMVWIHGGAYVAGSGESAKYDPVALVREGDVVVVNINYRLGIFGYLSPPGADADDNLGLRDQILALQWVRDNIAAFGGDPANVTVFGQSAGGDSVLALMLSPQGAGLFHRAIVQSAPLGVGTQNPAAAASREPLVQAMQSAMATSLAGVAPRDATYAQLLTAEAAAATAVQRFGLVASMAFAPLLGRDPLPPPAEIDERLAAAAGRIELLIGYTRDDAAPFVAMDPRVKKLSAFGVAERLAMRVMTPKLTARAFGGLVEPFVEMWRSHGGRAGSYRLDWRPAVSPLGACHCIDLPLLFGAEGRWSDAPMLGPNRTVDSALGADLRSVWTGFAHSGIAALPSEPLRFR